MTYNQHRSYKQYLQKSFLMTNKKGLQKISTITSVTFLSGILLTSTVLMMIPSAEAYDPQVQMWFGSKNTKDLGTFLKYEKYDGYGWHTKINVMIYAPGWNEDSLKMIRQSLFVSTISGSVALESAILGKIALIFGDSWFNDCPNVVNFHPDLTFTDLQEYEIKDSEMITK